MIHIAVSCEQVLNFVLVVRMDAAAFSKISAFEVL